MVQLRPGAYTMWAQQKHLVRNAEEWKQKQDGHQKKKAPSAPESLQASHYKRWGFSHYLQAVLCAACKYKQEGKCTCTRWNLQPFPICENEIQVHKDNTRLWLQPAPVQNPRPTAQAIKLYSPKFLLNKESENENIIFSQADGNCCFLTPDM